MAEVVQMGVQPGMQVPAVPRFWVTNMSVSGTDKEIVVLLGSSNIALDGDGQPQPTALPCAQVSFPVLAAKEFAAMLADVVKAIEAQTGEVTSEFLKSR